MLKSFCSILLFCFVFLQINQVLGQRNTRFNVYGALRNGSTFTAFNNSPNYAFLNFKLQKVNVIQLGIGLQFGRSEKSFWNLDFFYHSDNILVPRAFDSINITNAGELNRIHQELIFTRNNQHLNKTKLATYFGYGLSTSLDYSKFSPGETGIQWPAESWIGGLNINVQYRLVFKPSQRFWWQLGLSANTFRAGYNYSRTENPTFTTRQQTNGNFDFDFLTATRLFLGISFGKKKEAVEVN